MQIIFVSSCSLTPLLCLALYTSNTLHEDRWLTGGIPSPLREAARKVPAKVSDPQHCRQEGVDTF